MKVTTDQKHWRNVEEFKDCAREWAARIGVRPRRIQVQQMKRKWASCSSSGVVSFSTDLLLREQDFGEAVIVHELIHLKVPNHGNLFRSLFRAYMPYANDLHDGHLQRLD